jgi:hypothetical protein
LQRAAAAQACAAPESARKQCLQAKTFMMRRKRQDRAPAASPRELPALSAAGAACL